MTTPTRTESLRGVWRDGEKRLKATFGELAGGFSCRPDAERALETVAAECAPMAYDASTLYRASS
ncbi:MAG: hypothetical protein FWH47_04775 [Methanomassiliicoccaceae archaeon]|nr:hypothetical protein [Methanomassiliicoccaceae archaeon]